MLLSPRMALSPRIQSLISPRSQRDSPAVELSEPLLQGSMHHPPGNPSGWRKQTVHVWCGVRCFRTICDKACSRAARKRTAMTGSAWRTGASAEFYSDEPLLPP
jgi:hypothetical protein